MKKRFAIILTVAMLMSMLPAYAFGADDAAASGSTQAGSEAAAETHADGWDGDSYYIGGKAVTGPRYISGTATVNKKVKYYYNKKKKKWQTKKIKNAKTKYKKVKKKVKVNTLYLFDKNGHLVNKKGVFKHNGNEYYGLGGGKLKTGWVASGKNAMYFYDKGSKLGSMAKGTTIKYLKIPKNGRLGEAYALGVKQLNKSGWSLKKAYKFSYKLKYRNRWYRTKDAESYAIRGFTKKNGNCYVMASTFYIQAKLLGYNIRQVQGKVGIWPHSWTVIKQDGRWWVYDPNFKNETGRNGWKIWYGKRGTWRYSKYSFMN